MRSAVTLALVHCVTGIIAFQNGMHAAAALRRRLPAPLLAETNEDSSGGTATSSFKLPLPFLQGNAPPDQQAVTELNNLKKNDVS